MNRRLSTFLFKMLILCSLAGCNLPRPESETPTPTQNPSPPTATDSPSPSTAELGLAENPLILALPPSADSSEQIEAARLIAAQLAERTGYVVVTVVPDSEEALIDAFARGNAHIALLSPYAYELAYRDGSVKAMFAVVENGKGKYGAQFLAARRSGFTPYFNPVNQTNTINDARIALTQFNGAKPCWSDDTSPSGYVIPLGYLKANDVPLKPPAFVAGHPTVVRSLYASGICDFGATYIDARKFPSLEDEFPDLMEQVIVVWQIPEIIPHNLLAFSSRMPEPMRNLFVGLIPAVLQTDEGISSFKSVYDIEKIEPVNDGYYSEFRQYLENAELDLSKLIQ